MSNTETATKVKGEPKVLPTESESSAAEAALSYLERTMRLEIVDVNYKELVDKTEELQSIQELKENYITIAHSAAVEWRRMIKNMKDIINTQYEICSRASMLEEDYSDEYRHRMQVAADMEQALEDIVVLYKIGNPACPHDVK